MRVSVERDDPGYQRDTQHYLVTIDGEPVKFCLTADEEEGFVDVLVTDDAGNFVLNEARDEFVTEIKRGVVCVTTATTTGIPNP